MAEPMTTWQRSRLLRVARWLMWRYFCDGCGRTRGGYFSQPDAFAAAVEHGRACPALRLARLEAELEKLINQLRIDREEAFTFAKSSWVPERYLGLAEARGGLVIELSDILACHRGTDAH